MNNFSPGDRVMCVSGSNSGHDINIGQIYTVVRVKESDHGNGALVDIGRGFWWQKKHFAYACYANERMA